MLCTFYYNSTAKLRASMSMCRAVFWFVLMTHKTSTFSAPHAIGTCLAPDSMVPYEVFFHGAS